jgi:hypothetical protein
MEALQMGTDGIQGNLNHETNKSPSLLYVDVKMKDGDAHRLVIKVYLEHPRGPPHPNFLSKGSHPAPP